MAELDIRICRTFSVGPNSIVLVVPKTFGIEKGTQFLASKDTEGRIVYEPLKNALKEKPKS
jgi:hypothetical protein